MTTRRKVSVFVAMAICGAAVAVHALGFDEAAEVAPMLIPFQGTLNRDGNFLSGPVALRVSLYDAPSAGNRVWGPELHDPVQLTDGRFSIVLGSVSAFTQAVLGRKPLYLDFQVKVAGLDADFVPLLGRQQLLSTAYSVSARHATHGVPPGTIVAFGGTTAPYGWLLCDGSEVNRADFPLLFAAVGVAYGSAGAATFTLPDFRGRFLRGVDHGVGRDPDRAARTAMNAGGNSGDQVGSVEGGATRLPSAAFTTSSDGDHHHHYDDYYYSEIDCGNQGKLGSGDSDGDNAPCNWPGGRETGSAGAHTHTVIGGDAETRPANANVNWIIKV
jgi:Phage Tail Collar Domain